MCSNNYLLVVCLPFILLCVVSGSDNWNKCPSRCSSISIGDSKAADCSNLNLTAIPGFLDSEITAIHLSFNNFAKLSANAFQHVGLVILDKIILMNCQIKEIDKDAFKGLYRLSYLDLSMNNIHTIHPETFIDNSRLEILYVRENPIQTLKEGFFRELPYLSTIDFSNCSISLIDPKTFGNLPNLKYLHLQGNQLTHIQLSSVESLSNLKSLDLRFNPWNCDCHLREFRDYVISRGLYTRPPTCAEPSNLRCESWDSVDPEKFACKSKILYPPPGTIIKANGENVTLSCKVYGYPLPSMRWERKSLVMNQNSRSPLYEVKSSNPNGRKDELWLNLTISNIRAEDKGEYFCVINYLEGKEERIVNLDI